MTKTQLLFLIILIEGYVVLACELLAIRQLIPFVGSGVEIVALVVSGVLLPLAIGYHAGGTAYKRLFARTRNKRCAPLSVRKILVRNILIALLILAFGLSYLFLEAFFAFLFWGGVHHRLWQTLIYVVLFLIVPTFLLGQTVPLVSNYFSRRKLSEITGKMLFFSTTGAFLGSIFSTLVLMMAIGVHNTVIATLGLLAGLCFLLGDKKKIFKTLTIMAVVILFNNGHAFSVLNIVSDNAYNIVRVISLPQEESKVMVINRSYASGIARDPEKRFPYLKFIEDNLIKTMPANALHDILVIGAGGFTVGLDDKFNNYTFVDIDPDLKKVSEDTFLPEKLSLNKHFIADSARSFLKRGTKNYDLIVVDVFQKVHSVPMECTTREFFQNLRTRLKENGILAINVILTPDFQDVFTVRYTRTFADVFPVHSRQIIDNFNPWQKPDRTSEFSGLVNVVYVYFNRPLVNDMTVYTDNLNTYSIDRP